MQYIQVMIELETSVLSRPFTYVHETAVKPGCRVIVPFGKRTLCGLAVASLPENPDPEVRCRKIQQVLDLTPVLSVQQMQLAERLSHQSIASMMSIVHAMLPKAIAVKQNRPKAAMQTIVELTGLQESLTPAQQEALAHLQSGMTLLKAKELASAYMITALEKKGALIKKKRPIRHGALPPAEQKPWPVLNGYQERAIETIENTDKEVSLLHGVTGSGKTEVFFHLAREALAKKKQVLILVPEISLTPMMEQRFASRFDCPIYSCHSRLSDSQMLSVWNDVAASDECIVIGTRKSVFLPFSNLGLIILDEEHDSSYKQESYPRYSAREAALLLGEIFKCKVVLASATPSLESYARAGKNVYQLAELPVRAAGSDASISLVDLRQEQTWNQFSAPLIKAMTTNLRNKDKTLLLLNRRGYNPTVRCNNCHEFLVCEDCNLPLSYHKNEDALVCHVCGRRYRKPRLCPNCGCPALSEDGQGTERLEESTHELFPEAEIVRMDADTTRAKDAHARLLDHFEQEGDILLGTQMISKGLDYHDLTLGAILSIDSLIARPDYLACERAYQLAEQTAGRAGRGAKPGRVLIQTFRPDHYVLRCILSHSYRKFFEIEMRYRHADLYPPYTFLGTAVVTSADRMEAWGKAAEIAEVFSKEGAEILGPAEISMRKGQSRFRLIFKDRNDDHLRDLLWRISEWSEKNGRGCRIELNRNPAVLEE